MSSLALLLIGTIIILILIAIGVFISSNSERTLVEDRLGRFLGDEKTIENKEEAPTPLTEWVNRRVENSSLGDSISKNLARADLKFKAGEFVAFVFILASSLGAIAFLFVGTSVPTKLFSALLAASFGVVIPIIYKIWRPTT
jgi:tight adherence protein B